MYLLDTKPMQAPARYSWRVFIVDKCLKLQLFLLRVCKPFGLQNFKFLLYGIQTNTVQRLNFLYLGHKELVILYQVSPLSTLAINMKYIPSIHITVLNVTTRELKYKLIDCGIEF